MVLALRTLLASNKPIRIGVNAIGRTLSMHKLPPPITLPSVVSAIRGGAIDFDRSIVRLDAIGAYPIVAAIVSAHRCSITILFFKNFPHYYFSPKQRQHYLNKFMTRINTTEHYYHLFTQLMGAMLDSE